jgi:hypothetical protein
MSWLNGLCKFPSEPQGPGPPPIPPTHSLHYCDANDIEIRLNREFFEDFEEMFRPDTDLPLNMAFDTLIDYIFEARKLERLPDRGEIESTFGLEISVQELLVHIPVQLGPLPRGNNCPCAFCDECPNPNAMAMHLARKHTQVFINGLFYSEMQLELAGLLAISLQMRKGNAWKCPFHYCPSDDPRYATMQEHVRMERTEDEKHIYSGVGGFWATLIVYFHQTGRWPMASDIFFKANQDRVRVQMAPLAREGADALWREGEHRIRQEDIGINLICPGTPLEPLLRRLRAEGSSQPSRETSAPPERITDPESSSDEEDQALVEEIARVRAEIAVLSDEIDSETDTEHEPPEVSPTEQQFEEVEGIHPEIVERMRKLREVFTTEELEGEERDQKLHRLEDVLRRF